MAEEQAKRSLRQRLHYWLCDVFNVVSQDYFIDFCESMDRYLYTQNTFNRLVGSKLKLNKEADKKSDEDNKERGMFG